MDRSKFCAIVAEVLERNSIWVDPDIAREIGEDILRETTSFSVQSGPLDDVLLLKQQLEREKGRIVCPRCRGRQSFQGCLCPKCDGKGMVYVSGGTVD